MKLAVIITVITEYIFVISIAIVVSVMPASMITLTQSPVVKFYYGVDSLVKWVRKKKIGDCGLLRCQDQDQGYISQTS